MRTFPFHHLSTLRFAASSSQDYQHYERYKSFRTVKNIITTSVKDVKIMWLKTEISCNQPRKNFLDLTDTVQMIELNNGMSILKFSVIFFQARKRLRPLSEIFTFYSNEFSIQLPFRGKQYKSTVALKVMICSR